MIKLPLKVYIVEDEAPVRDEIKYMLEQHSQLEVVGEADNSFEALCYIQNLRPDVVFLDIKLGGIDGITLARKIREIQPLIKLVFVTAYENYALEGFELNAVDYVLKPFNEARLAKTVERLILNRTLEHKEELSGRNNDKIAVKCEQTWKLLSLNEVCFFQSQGHTTTANTVAESYRLNYTLRDLEERLGNGKFIRTHKSFILNLDCINEIIPWFNYTYKVTLKGHKSEIPVSRNYLKQFKDIIELV